MKKFLLIALAILVFLAGSFYWVWRTLGITDPSVLVPSDTVMLTALPDLPRTILRWPGTALAKIAGEQELRDFLEKPLAQLAKNEGGKEAAEILLKLKPGRLFLAVPSVSSQDARILVGFQFWGGKGNYDSSVARLRAELAKVQPPTETKTIDYEGNTITASSHGPTSVLYSVAEGHWGFLSNNLEAIKDAMDRASGRVKTGSLSENPQYREVSAKLLKDPDFFFYVQPKPLLDTLLHVGSTMGAQANPKQVEELRAIQAVGASMKMEGENFHDNMFMLRPNPPNIGELKHNSIKLTSPNTMAYFDFLADFSQLATFAAEPNIAAMLSNAAEQSTKIIALAPEAFGPECALSLLWEPNQMKPDGVLAVQVKDAAKADECLQQIVSLFPEAGRSEMNGVRYYSFPALQKPPFFMPTIALGEGFLLTGLSEVDVQRAMDAVKKGDSLDKSPAFAPAIPAYNRANEMFGYIDSRQLFDRVYKTVQPIVSFSMGLNPNGAEWLDTNKFPKAETITKHLQPITYSRTRLDNGYLTESSGPITLNQAVVLGGGTALLLIR